MPPKASNALQVIKQAPSTSTEIVESFYTAEEEEVLVEIADKAKVFRWLHERAYQFYWVIYALFMIPVIILSTIAGVGSYAQSRFSGEAAEIAPMVIGSISLIAGILSTLLQFLKVAESMEGCRQASLSWGKFGRNIALEVAKHPKKRKKPQEFLDFVSAEYDRLMEISPVLPPHIVKLFNHVVPKPDDLVLPDICGELTHTSKWQETITIDRAQDGSDGALERSHEVERALSEAFYRTHGRYPSPLELDKANTS